MSYVAKQRVVMSGLVWELAHRHRAMTSALMLEEQRHRKRGFAGFGKIICEFLRYLREINSFR